MNNKIKLFCLLMCFLISESIFSGDSNVFYFGSDEAVNLTNRIRFDDNKTITVGLIDPSTISTTATPGSLYLSDNGNVYIKRDTGSSTNWTHIDVDNYLLKDGSRHATGNFTFEQDVLITGTAVISKDLTVNGTAATFNDIIVNDDATLSDDLSVSGNATFLKNFTSTATTAFFTHDISVNGTVSLIQLAIEGPLNNVLFTSKGGIIGAITGQYNTIIGPSFPARAAPSGFYNTIIGPSSGVSMTNGNDNTFIGPYAGYKNTSGSYNSCIGEVCLGENTTGTTNECFGYNCITANSTGSNNVCVGQWCLGTGTENVNRVALGPFAGYKSNVNDVFVIDNQNRSTIAGEQANALMYGFIKPTAAQSTLKINAGNVTFSGSISITATEYITGGLEVTSTSTFSNNVVMSKGLKVTNDSTFSNDITVSSTGYFANIELTNDATINRNLNVTKDITATGTIYAKGGLEVTSTSTFSNNVVILKGLNVTNDSTFNNDITVSSTGYFVNVELTNDATINRNLNVTKDITSGGTVSISGGLNVTHTATFQNEIVLSNIETVGAQSYYLTTNAGGKITKGIAPSLTSKDATRYAGYSALDGNEFVQLSTQILAPNGNLFSVDNTTRTKITFLATGYFTCSGSFNSVDDGDNIGIYWYDSGDSARVVSDSEAGISGEGLSSLSGLGYTNDYLVIRCQGCTGNPPGNVINSHFSCIGYED